MFVPSDVTQFPDPTDYAQNLKFLMNSLHPVPPRVNLHPKSYMDPALHSNTHVFIRQDKVKKFLQQPYTGPFKVLSRTTKHFTIDVNGRREVISVDRLKPANLLVEERHCKSYSAQKPWNSYPPNLQLEEPHVQEEKFISQTV